MENNNLKQDLSIDNETNNNTVKTDEDDELVVGPWNKPRTDLKTIKVITGEEDEECIWKCRAKLYRWSSGHGSSESNEWRERGTGEAKLLQHKNKKIIRFLLRQEKTFKVVANHYIIQTDIWCRLTPNVSSDKIWVWTVKDYAEDSPRIEQFALRFSQLEQAQLFKRKFDEAAAINKDHIKNFQSKSLDGDENTDVFDQNKIHHDKKDHDGKITDKTDSSTSKLNCPKTIEKDVKLENEKLSDEKVEKV